MSKYNAMGNLYDVLGEECAEVIHATFKAKRFGLEGTGFRVAEGKASPRSMIIQELADLLVIAERMEDQKLIDYFSMDDVLCWQFQSTSDGLELLQRACHLLLGTVLFGKQAAHSTGYALACVKYAALRCEAYEIFTSIEVGKAKMKKEARLIELYGEEWGM